MEAEAGGVTSEQACAPVEIRVTDFGRLGGVWWLG